MLLEPLLDPDGVQLTDPYGMPMYEEWDISVVPEGKAMGALPRTDVPGSQCEFFRDKFRQLIVDPKDWPELIKAGGGDQRKYVNWIYNQDGIGSCATEGVCACVDSDREHAGLPKVKFNPWPTYYLASGGRDQGSTLTENLKLARDRGLVPDALWPRASHSWNDMPPQSAWDGAKKYRIDEFYEIGNTVEAGSALLTNHRVYAAYPGHAWQLIALLNTLQGIWRNSWGEEWGDKGYGVISLNQLTYDYGLFGIRTTLVEF